MRGHGSFRLTWERSGWMVPHPSSAFSESVEAFLEIYGWKAPLKQRWSCFVNHLLILTVTKSIMYVDWIVSRPTVSYGLKVPKNHNFFLHSHSGYSKVNYRPLYLHKELLAERNSQRIFILFFILSPPSIWVSFNPINNPCSCSTVFSW